MANIEVIAPFVEMKKVTSLILFSKKKRAYHDKTKRHIKLNELRQALKFSREIIIN